MYDPEHYVNESERLLTLSARSLNEGRQTEAHILAAQAEVNVGLANVSMNARMMEAMRS